MGNRITTQISSSSIDELPGVDVGSAVQWCARLHHGVHARSGPVSLLRPAFQCPSSLMALEDILGEKGELRITERLRTAPHVLVCGIRVF